MTNRRCIDLGIKPLICYITLIVVFLGLSIYLFKKTELAEFIFLFLAFIFIGRLSEFRRNEFLKICYGDSKQKKIRIAENLISSIPFIIILIYNQLFYSVVLLFIMTVVLALVKFRTTSNLIIWSPFSKRLFEFTIGFRKYFYLFYIAYILTFISVYYDNYNLGIFSIIMVFIIILSFYTSPENQYCVWTYKLNPKEFLFNKIYTAMIFSSYLILPIAIIIAIYFPKGIMGVLIYILAGWSFVIKVIVSKYSVYPNEMTIMYGIILLFSIWFPPIVILLIPYLFSKSVNRLNSLLK